MGRQAKDPRAVQQDACAGPPSGQRMAERFLAAVGNPSDPTRQLLRHSHAGGLERPPGSLSRCAEFLTERVLSSHPEGDSQTAARTTALASSQWLGTARTRQRIGARGCGLSSGTGVGSLLWS
jgi:hypothetical protein